MPKIASFKSALSSRIFNPLEVIYQDTESRYVCGTISDLDYAALGVARCLTHAKTGHEFLQHHAEHDGPEIEVSHFFKALKSKRRFGNLTSLNDHLASHMNQEIGDPFSGLEELKGFDLYAADGHYQKAACYDPKPKSPGGRTMATGHFFRLNLRTHHLSHLDLSLSSDGKKKDHDTTIIKRAEAHCLRYGAQKGRKVFYAWDKACIDYRKWFELKSQYGIYFVTREKSNSVARQVSIEIWDRQDPRNEGVKSDYLVDTSTGVQLRRVVYTDPGDGTTYTYLTNEMTLPPWAIVLVYRYRWDIEKVFDELKNKMMETKSWASSEIAKRAHGVFECLAHNLATLFENEMREVEKLTDEVEQKKSKARQLHRTNREGRAYQEAENFINQIVQRATQRTVRFIRWLRVWLYREATWEQARARLAKVWGSKI